MAWITTEEPTETLSDCGLTIEVPLCPPVELVATFTVTPREVPVNPRLSVATAVSELVVPVTGVFTMNDSV